MGKPHHLIDVTQIWSQAREAKNARARAMPTAEDALTVMREAYERLKDLGFNDIIYCPKDGAIFQSVSVGSTGIHDTHYWGDWPDGGWFVHEAGDLWPAQPCLWRPRKAGSDKRTGGNT